MLFPRTIIILILLLITVLDWIFKISFRQIFVDTLCEIKEDESSRCLFYQLIQKEIKQSSNSTIDKIKRHLGIYPRMSKNDREMLDDIKKILKRNKIKSCCDDAEECKFIKDLRGSYPDNFKNIDATKICAFKGCPLFKGFTNIDHSIKLDDLNDMWNVIWRGCTVRAMQISFFWAITLQIIIFLGSLRGYATATDFELLNNYINFATVPILVVFIVLLGISYSNTRPIPIYEIRVLRLFFLIFMFALIVYVSQVVTEIPQIANGIQVVTSSGP